MASDRHAAVVESLKATASELHARPHDNMNEDWADLMAQNLASAGLLAAPKEPVVHQRWRDRQGDVWLETVGRILRLVEFKGQTHLDGSVQGFAEVEATWGPLAPVPEQQDDDRAFEPQPVRSHRVWRLAGWRSWPQH